MSGWPRYPPCASGTCTDVVCCAHGTFDPLFSISFFPSFELQSQLCMYVFV